jgi:SAM-dependent methyltransferase
MSGNEEFTDPRLVAVYDSSGPHGVDFSFYRHLAATTAPESIVDIGCGTGQLSVALARDGHRVTGVDPSPAMLAVAAGRDGGDLVRWIHGDASCLAAQEYDLAVMSGNVAQVITDDRLLMATFAAIHRALRPRGRLALDIRDPAARAWWQWNPEHSRRALPGGVEVWHESTREHGDRVSTEVHYVFPDGQELVSHNELRFWSYAWLRQALRQTGFQVDPVEDGKPDLVVIAHSGSGQQPVALHIDSNADGEWFAAVLYDSSETVTVPLTGLDTTEVLQKLFNLGVPQELVLSETDRLDLGWDVRDEVRQRSEADMGTWRQRDRERREQLKRDFRRREP